MIDTKKYKQILTFLVIVLTGFAGLSGYCIIACETEIDFRINWNMFNSILIWPLYIAGIVAGFWMKFDDYVPVTKTEDSYGNTKVERDYDIIRNMETGCIMPILLRFILAPLMIAALVYYLLMSIIYLFGVIFPYLIAVFLIFTLVFFYKWEQVLIVKRSRLWKMPLVMLLFTGAIWLLYILWVPSGESSVAWMNPIALGVVLATVILFIVMAVREKNQVSSGGADSMETDNKPAVIPKPFLITYIVSLLCVLVLYGFQSGSSDTSSYRSDTAEVQEYTLYSVTATSLNVRNRPDKNAQIIGKLSANQDIRVYEIDSVSHFAKISTGGLAGYVSDEYIKPKMSGQTSSPISSSTPARTRNKASEVEWKNSIPAMDGVMGISTDYTKLKRITAEERKSLQIDQIRLEDVDMNKYLNKQIAKGKTIYKSVEGRMETFLVIVEDNATYEYLISYDALGNYVDCITFGQHILYAGDLQTGHIEGNKIKLSYSWAEPGSEWGEGISMIYTIMDDLHFKAFSWPPKSYPCETPFMTYESEKSTPLYWQIESITCTGASGNAYTFTIKGKGITDCKNASPEERSVRLTPADKTATITLPAVGEGEAFEAEVKALYKGTFDEKVFKSFVMKR
jgi:hypothetical protein